MSQDNAVLLQLNAKLTARKLLENGTGYFYAVFFTQIKFNPSVCTQFRRTGGRVENSFRR
jgi:hypothetical protein